jgi:hypothetical protein
MADINLKDYFSKVRKLESDAMLLDDYLKNGKQQLEELNKNHDRDYIHLVMSIERYDRWIPVDRYWTDKKPKIEQAYAGVRRKLDDLYNQNIIFPKYRHFVEVHQMAEYLDSGRCSALEGPDGAYNLYESELRQNYIISKLDTIINQLDMIRENQYYIYTAMQDIRTAIAGLNLNVVINRYL